MAIRYVINLKVILNSATPLPPLASVVLPSRGDLLLLAKNGIHALNQYRELLITLFIQSEQQKSPLERRQISSVQRENRGVLKGAQ